MHTYIHTWIMCLCSYKRQPNANLQVYTMYTRLLITSTTFRFTDQVLSSGWVGKTVYQTRHDQSQAIVTVTALTRMDWPFSWQPSGMFSRQYLLLGVSFRSWCSETHQPYCEQYRLISEAHTACPCFGPHLPFFERGGQSATVTTVKDFSRPLDLIPSSCE